MMNIHISQITNQYVMYMSYSNTSLDIHVHYQPPLGTKLLLLFIINSHCFNWHKYKINLFIQLNQPNTKQTHDLHTCGNSTVILKENGVVLQLPKHILKINWGFRGFLIPPKPPLARKQFSITRILTASTLILPSLNIVS